MKKLIVVSALAASSVAMAADLKFNVEGRFDYVNSTIKHEYTTSTNNYENKKGDFLSNIIRLNAVYTINENLSGRFRYRFSTAQVNDSTANSSTNTMNRDLSFQNVDFFYVDHKTPWFTTRIGKQNHTEALGREYFVSGTDYNVTEAKFASAGAQGKDGYTTVNSAVYNQVKNDADIYNVGASLMFSQIPNSTLTVALFEPQKAQTDVDTAAAANPAKNTKMGMGLYYNGTFFEKMLQPTLGFTTFGVPAGSGVETTPSATHKLMAVGARSEVMGVVVDLDWKQYKREKTTTADNSDKTSSIYANVAYTWDMLTPFVSYIHDKYDMTAANTTANTDYKRDALTVGLQIKPFKDNNFRYHVTYTNDVRKNDLASGTTMEQKVTSNTVAAGIKFDL